MPLHERSALAENICLWTKLKYIECSRNETMPLERNVHDFKRFIQDHGQVTPEQADTYADIGQEIIKYAINSPTFQEFEKQIHALQSQHIDVLGPMDGPHSVSNMASVLLYAQTHHNFKLGQGYGKGVNINQYGNSKESSERAVANLMTYFSKERPGQEYGYDAPSTHGKWINKNIPLPESIPNMKLRIDIDEDPKSGSIPAPLKGIRTLHMVPGVDDDGVVKLLVKPENWGMKKLVHKISHFFDYLFTRVFSQEIKGLDARQETKYVKEAAVADSYEALKTDLANSIDKVENKDIKSLFIKINAYLKSFQEKKGLDAPIEILEKVDRELNSMIEHSPESPCRGHAKQFQKTVQVHIASLEDAKRKKYSSAHQKFSEVRLQYNDEGRPAMDKTASSSFKSKFSEMRHKTSQNEEAPEEQIQSRPKFS